MRAGGVCVGVGMTAILVHRIAARKSIVPHDLHTCVVASRRQAQDSHCVYVCVCSCMFMCAYVCIPGGLARLLCACLPCKLLLDRGRQTRRRVALESMRGTADWCARQASFPSFRSRRCAQGPSVLFLGLAALATGASDYFGSVMGSFVGLWALAVLILVSGVMRSRAVHLPVPLATSTA